MTAPRTVLALVAASLLLLAVVALSQAVTGLAGDVVEAARWVEVRRW